MVGQFLQQLRALKREAQLLCCYGALAGHAVNSVTRTRAHAQTRCVSEVLHLTHLNIGGAARV